MTFTRTLGRGAAIGLLASLLAGTQPACAQETDAALSVPIQIEAGPLSAALREFAAQAGTPVLFSEQLTAGYRADTLTGTLRPEDALAQLLSQTELEAMSGPGGVFVIRRKKGEEKPARIPEAAPAREPSSPDSEAGAAARETEMADRLIADTILVTGTSLRGLAPETSPLQVYDHDDILGSGVTTIDQFIRALPQNFGGGSSEFTSVGLPNDANSRANNTYGASANLRGLGSRGTLVLLNGSRLAPTSEIGDFVDLSLIPVSALDRVEVLTDGASSIYGGDAVAGVINFILRDDFDGAETALRYGQVTSGEMQEIRASQTLGRSWSGGNLLATYEYFDRGNLTLADRPEIGLFDGASDAFDLPDPALFDLLPEQRRDSLVLAGRQDVTAQLSLDATLLYSDRSTHRSQFGRNGTVEHSGSGSEGLTLALGADQDLPGGWLVSLEASYSQVRNEERRREVYRVDDLPFSDSRIETDSDVWAVDARISGDLIQLPAGPLKAALGAQIRQESFANEILGDRISAEGERDVAALFGEVQIPLVGEGTARPGLQRLELNLSGRLDEYSDFGSSANPKLGLLWSPVGGLNLRGSYSTSFAPPALGRAFSVSRTGQILPYQFILDLFGLEAPDPGLADMDYMQILGTQADLDPETSRTFTLGFDAALRRGPHAWRASGSWYDIEFEDRLGTTPVPNGLLDFHAPNIAWEDPSAFPEGSVIFYPTAQEIEALVATFQRPIGVLMDASLDRVGIINNVNVVRNLARTETRGIDLQLDYETKTEWGEFSASLNLNHILDFTQQAAASTPAVPAIDTYLNPVDLKVRGQFGWSRDGLSANLFLNHSDAYQTDGTEAAVPIEAWTTADLSLTQEVRFGEAAWLRAARLSLSVINLFDEAPPQTPSDGVYGLAGYDPTNASPLNRFVAIEIRSSF
ncbi:TonB-dependent receptor [Hyphomonas sp.]|uniref:TonB-dependent receptor n=1 Tax=Hyphomonas sp. TaxID=87 RepID=UPI0030020DD7